MLQKIRDNSQGIMAKIFVGLVVVVFGLWGVQYLVGTFTSTGPVVTVNGTEITENQVAGETQRVMQQMRSQQGQDASIDEVVARERAINNLVQQELLFQTAQEAGMAISEQAIDRQIAQIPDFQVDGVFNNERAQAILRSSGYTPSTFRASLRRDALLSQVIAAYSNSSFVTPFEEERLAALTQQTRDFRYLMIDMSDQAGSIEISQDDIEQYYQNNQQEFMREEQVALNYLELNRNDIAGEVSVSEEDIRSQYEREREAFGSQVERRASHILLEAATGEERQQALAQARELKAMLDEGADFAQLAMEYSDDTGSAEDGGDVGYTTGDSFVEPFEEALRQLEVDEVSDPVVTEFGVHLIRLTERSETEFDSFEEARERIANDLRNQEAERMYQQRAERLGNLAFESQDLQQPAEIMGLEIQSTDLFGRSGGTGIAAMQPVIDAAFSPVVLQDRLNSELIRLSDTRSVVIHVTEHQPPAVRPLSEVRPEIEGILRNQRIRERERNLGETIVNNLNNDQNINTILEEQGLTWTAVNDTGRDNTEVNPQLLNEAFSMPRPDVNDTNITGLALDTGGYAVIELQGVSPGSVEDLEEGELQSLRAFVSQQTGSSDFNAFMSSLRATAEIER